MSSRAARPRCYYGWLIVAALSLTETTSWGILYCGLTALSVGLIGGMQLPGRLAFLPLGRKLSRRALTLCVALLQNAALLVLLLVDSLGGVPLFVALFGMANGMASLLAALCFHFAETSWARLTAPVFAGNKSTPRRPSFPHASSGNPLAAH